MQQLNAHCQRDGDICRVEVSGLIGYVCDWSEVEKELEMTIKEDPFKLSNEQHKFASFYPCLDLANPGYNFIGGEQGI